MTITEDRKSWSRKTIRPPREKEKISKTSVEGNQSRGGKRSQKKRIMGEYDIKIDITSRKKNKSQRQRRLIYCDWPILLFSATAAAGIDRACHRSRGMVTYFAFKLSTHSFSFFCQPTQQRGWCSAASDPGWPASIPCPSPSGRQHRRSRGRARHHPRRSWSGSHPGRTAGSTSPGWSSC